MKTLLLGALLLSTAIPIHAQNDAGTQPQDTPYSVILRGPHENVWERTTFSQLPSGGWITNIDDYVETATGLNFDAGAGQFQPSSPEIVANANGFAALNAQHKVTFAADLATAGAIGLQTPDGQEQLNMHLLGLCYLDQASGKSVWIAEVTNSIGQIIAPNQVWYESAFSGVNGAVSYINTLAGLEQNVVDDPTNIRQFTQQTMTACSQYTILFDPYESPTWSPFKAPRE